MTSEKEYSKTIEKTLSDSRISKSNLEILKYYDSQGKLQQQITLGTRVVRLNIIRQLALFLGSKNFKDVTKEDIEAFILSRGEWQPKTWSTNGAYIKFFFKWLNNSDEYPSNVKWIKTSMKSKNRKLPSDLLTLDEIKAMAKAGNPMERAFIKVLYESACRIGEILNLKIKDVSVDQYGSALMVDGKTGMRRIRLIDSSPDLVLWIDKHPKKHDRDSCLFIQNHSKTDCKGLTDSYADTILIKLVKSAGIKKHVHPHLFRHSRLTELARDFSESELKVIAGWSGNSNMAAVYVHLSGGDIEKKMLERRGLLNKENDNLTLGRVSVSPGRPQGVKVSPEPGMKVSPDQRVKEISEELTEFPFQKLTLIHRKPGRPPKIIQGFTLSLYKFIKKHEGVSISEISDISLKKKESVKPILSRLKNYGFIMNSKGNWYPTSKELIP
ncbi:MAG: tyrosine-type recombinase/integrase [Candidatus Methanoperedens sp.]|nr:tyrosine-type recombinase/integrase [Candidatus Methanoperedens sp.]